MISPQEEKRRIQSYNWAYKHLMETHMKRPTVVETCIFVMTMKKEDVSKILELMQKVKKKDKNE